MKDKIIQEQKILSVDKEHHIIVLQPRIIIKSRKPNKTDKKRLNL